MKIKDIDNLIKEHGNITFQQLKEKLLNDTPHICPKCNGGGFIQEEYNAYPSGYPDSGWVVDMKFKSVPCDICNTKGYTKKLLKPVIETKILRYE